MAQKKSTKKNTSASRSKTGAGKGRKAPAKRPIRREVGAFVCLGLAILTAIGYFTSKGWLIWPLAVLEKGLLGVGWFLMAPALILGAFILGTHRGRPVQMRLVCALLLPLLCGAFVQSVVNQPELSFGWSLFKDGWAGGTRVTGGGALGGALATLLTKCITVWGTRLMLVAGMIFCLFVSMSLRLSELWNTVKNHEVLPYDEADYPQPEKKEVRPPVVTRVSRNIDIPLDDESPAGKKPGKTPEKKNGLFNRTPNVATPGDYLAGKKEDVLLRDISDAVEIAADGEEDSMPIVIPASHEELYPEDLTAHIPTGEVRGEDFHAAIMEATHREVPENEEEDIPEDMIPDIDQSLFDPVPVETVAMPESPKKKGKPVSAASIEKEVRRAAREADAEDYVFPSLSLLATGSGQLSDSGREEMDINRDRLENALSSFGINSLISNIVRGPSVTRYEMALEAGVKLNKITNLSDDIALSLGASGVRIAAIPDKVATVGIEVPNKSISTVYLRDIIASDNFQSAKSKLTFAIGKNISGEAVVGNIAKLPHMLVAGTTGSGKSVCLNSLILSILYKAKPDEVKFIMVDPKMVEFRIYNGIPHLLIPVVTEAKKAAGALQWAVTEMMKRYRLFSESNARDLAGYNKAIENGNEEGEKLPQIVVVIDELADLMMIAAKEVEESICRIAQMGRAAGVHLVIATQSPRADVITGLMKANIPSRIALKVSSALESRIILDAGGNADKLVGNGDMLYAPIGTSKPLRIQGTWVSDEEREAIIDFIKQSGEAQYNEEVIHQIERAAEDKSAADKNEEAEAPSDFDELLPQAVDVVFESGQASVSMLQRRLKLGYSRAARIVDQMEEIGVVGPYEGSKPRQLMITRAQWQEMQMLHGTAPVEGPMGADGYAAQNMQSAEDLFEDEE